ncbi:MAG: hypothetical protein EXS03_07510 [Phycisphaerales bacterium]|nr:hypothetical protein [Phycisphaerales bacterium]
MIALTLARPIALSLSLLIASDAKADAFDDAMALVPADAISAHVAPSLAKVSKDIDECLALMDRKETVVAGRPVDHLRAALGIREGFNENGSMALWSVKMADGAVPAWVLLVPTDDPAAFLKANVEPGSDGVAQFRGEAVFTRALEKHVIASRSRDAIDRYASGGGLGSVLAARLGQHAMDLARNADIVSWSGPEALAKAFASSEAEGNTPGTDGLPNEVLARLGRLREVGSGLSDLLIAVDIDALGLSVRSVARLNPGSALANLAAQSTDVSGDGGATLRGVHGGPFLIVASIDVTALGGAGKLDDIAALVGASDAIPAWLASAKEGVRRLSFACYPSKLGVLAGGLLNDATLIVETDNPATVRDLFKSSLLEAAGTGDGVRREPSWEDGRTLKDGTVTDAYELKESALGPSEAGDAKWQEVAMRQMMRQAIFGPRGMHGFVKALPSALIVTFSQRPDVLARAMETQQGGESMASDAAIKSMRSWLVPGAQIEVFISVGQLLKIARQMADAFAGGAGQLPSIPTRSAPVALAIRAAPDECEVAVMVPTVVLGAVYDQAIASVMGDRVGPGPKPEPPATPVP